MGRLGRMGSVGLAVTLLGGIARALPERPDGMRAGGEAIERPSFELGATAGIGFPYCQAEGACTGIGAGPSVGLVGVGRPAPVIGVGFALDYTRFAWDAEDGDFHDPSAWTSTRTVLLIGRLYALEQGWADPFLQVGIGQSAFGTSVERETCPVDDGFALHMGAGFDAYVSRSVRLASFAGSTLVGGGGGGCEEELVFNAPPPSSGVSLGLVLRLGATFGAPPRTR